MDGGPRLRPTALQGTRNGTCSNARQSSEMSFRFLSPSFRATHCIIVREAGWPSARGKLGKAQHISKLYTSQQATNQPVWIYCGFLCRLSSQKVVAINKWVDAIYEWAAAQPGSSVVGESLPSCGPAKCGTIFHGFFSFSVRIVPKEHSDCVRSTPFRLYLLAADASCEIVGNEFIFDSGL